MKNRPRLLIENWLPAAAIGVECMRERGTGQQPPDKRFHVWWARRPLCVSRAAVLGSLLPADFPHDAFERLLGFWGSSREILAAQNLLEVAQARGGSRIANPHGNRAFKRPLRDTDLSLAHASARSLWEGPHVAGRLGEGSHVAGRSGRDADGDTPSLPDITVLDPMAGGGSIPLESARLGFRTLANEYNPVACSVLEATVDYPFRFGGKLADQARHWGKEWRKRFNARMNAFFPTAGTLPPHCYIFARTVPCPDTGHATPLVPDWHLLKPKGSNVRVWAEPVVDKTAGTWTVRIVDNREPRNRAKTPPAPTYGRGSGISLFSGQQIPDDWIKAQAQAGGMQSALYAVAVKTPNGLKFEPPTETDLQAIAAAETELARHRERWERDNTIPTENYPAVTTDERPRIYGMPRWADLFSPRQLLGFGVLVEELRALRPDIIAREGSDLGEAVVHLMAFVLDKFLNHNCTQTRWENTRSVIKSKMDRHDYAFKTAFAEMAPCGAGTGFDWAINNVTDAFEQLAKLPAAGTRAPVFITAGSATNLPAIADQSITAVVVDPPYADNVQYAELADFFYVWLKRTQGHRRPEWFSNYLCDHAEEAVVNVPRHRGDDDKAADARRKANAFYQHLMGDVFTEARRILRDDGALTVMFTHKKQEAWQALFTSLVKAGFTITATWPVKTESEHSLHQAKKNAAQSTVILVARKRDADAGIGYFDADMRGEIRFAARKTAERLMKEGLNPVDQLVGSFGPAMEVYSRHAEVRTDTGDPVGVNRALDEASEAVADFRIQQLAERGLQGVEAEGRFYLLCWDVLQAAEFRFNEANLLGKAVGMEMDAMVMAGLVSKTGDKVRMLAAQERRRAKKLEPEEVEETLFGPLPTGKKKRVTQKDVRKVHPNDPRFRTALDACHALALRYNEAGGGNPGIGSARQLAVQQGWKGGSPVALLLEALVKAAPPALWFRKTQTDAAAQYPEFRAWHALLKPLFGETPPEWTEEFAEPEMPLFAAANLGEDDEEEPDDNGE